jgi:hypothetical protein
MQNLTPKGGASCHLSGGRFGDDWLVFFLLPLFFFSSPKSQYSCISFINSVMLWFSILFFIFLLPLFIYFVFQFSLLLVSFNYFCVLFSLYYFNFSYFNFNFFYGLKFFFMVFHVCLLQSNFNFITQSTSFDDELGLSSIFYRVFF